MRRLFESGVGFMIVALLCFVTAIVSEEARGVFVGAGAFWLIMAVIVRSKHGKERSRDTES